MAMPLANLDLGEARAVREVADSQSLRLERRGPENNDGGQPIAALAAMLHGSPRAGLRVHGLEVQLHHVAVVLA